MIKIERTTDGSVQTKIKGEAADLVEELLNASISICKSLIEHGKLDKDQLEDFIDDFAQQIKDNIKINN